MHFISKYLGYKQTITPPRYLYNAHGERTFVAGEIAKFQDGRFETSDPRLIDELMRNPMYGIDFWAVDGSGQPIAPNAEGQKIVNEDKLGIGTTVHSCPKCSFKAKNLAGLKGHIAAKHPIADES